MDFPISIDAGVTKARYGLILADFDAHRMRVVGMWDELAEAKTQAVKRFQEFHPGMAMIQDTESGVLLQAYNWHHDCLMWTEFNPNA